jgi:hypothetical protein
VGVTATLPHPDRLATRDRPPASEAADLDLAVEHLARLIAGAHGDRLAALETVARIATRLARPHRHSLRFDEERPAPAAGVWSLEQGMVPHIVLGEN